MRTGKVYGKKNRGKQREKIPDSLLTCHGKTSAHELMIYYGEHHYRPRQLTRHLMMTMRMHCNLSIFYAVAWLERWHAAQMTTGLIFHRERNLTK